MNKKNKKALKISSGIFVIGLTSFGLLVSSHQETKGLMHQSNTIINYQKQITNNNLKKDLPNVETHIEGVQNSQSTQAILASHTEKGGAKKYSFYVESVGKTKVDKYFISSGTVDGYSKIDLSVLKANENIEGWIISTNDFSGEGGIAFWTKTTSDNKYHIYTAGHVNSLSSNFLGREVKSDIQNKTFTRIKNPKDNTENFDEIKELSLTWGTLTIWTKETSGNDHIYFCGTNNGQYGSKSLVGTYNKLFDGISYIKTSINNKKIKDIAFDNPYSGFILTEDNILYAAGSDANNQLGVQQDSPDRQSWTYKKVNAPKLDPINDIITQMSNDFSYFVTTRQSLILLTKSKKDNSQKVWVLGFAGFSGSVVKPLKLGSKDEAIDHQSEYYYEHLKNISLDAVDLTKEKILYCSTQTYSATGNAYSSDVSFYSAIITKNKENNKYKIYTTGFSKKIKSIKVGEGDKFSYNDYLTKEIFGDNGLEINFDIKNLGNSKNSMPVFFSPMGPVAEGKIKNKEQEKALVVVGEKDDKKGEFTSWSTAKNEPPVIDKDATITNKVDPKNSSKGIITYTFNINLNGNTLQSYQIIDPNQKVSDEKYELKAVEETNDSKKMQVIISNIDISKVPDKDLIYNGADKDHKFQLKIVYKSSTLPGPAKTIQKINTFNSFTIGKDIKIDIEKDGNPEIQANKFIYNFKMTQTMGNYKWAETGQAETGLKASIIKNSKLEKSGAKIDFRKGNGENKYSFVVTKVPNAKQTFDLDKCILLEGKYKDKKNSFPSSVWNSQAKKVNFGKLDFNPVSIKDPAFEGKATSIEVTPDHKNPKTGSLTYTFNLNMNTEGNQINILKTKVLAPSSKNADIKYTLDMNKSNIGQKWKVTISNIDLSLPKGNDRTYNGKNDKFKLQIVYTNTKYPGTPEKTITIQNPFNPYVIHKDIKINVKKDSVEKTNNSFTYNFKMTEIMGSYTWKSKGKFNTGLTPTLIKNSKLDKLQATWQFKHIKGDLYSLVVTNLPNIKDTYNLDKCFLFEGQYKDSSKDNSKMDWVTWKSQDNITFGNVQMSGPDSKHTSNSTKIIVWTTLGISLFILLLLILWILLRKKNKK